jgi:hypothetical protein
VSEPVNLAQRDRRRRPARRRWLRPALVALAFLLVFLVGLSFGKALEEGPAPTTTNTIVRTLEPLPQTPAG